MRLGLLFWLLLLFGCESIQAPTPSATPIVLSQPEFQRRVAERLIELEPQWKIMPGTPVKLQAPGDFSLELPLDRIFAIYEKSPGREKELIEEGAQACLSSWKRTTSDDAILLDYTKVSPYLLPGVVPAGSYEPSQGILIRPFSKHVSVIYYYDHPDSPNRVLLQPEHLAKWRLTPEALHKKAVENLAKFAPTQVTQERFQQLGSVYVLEPADDYSAARILLTPALEDMASKAGDDLRLWVPARDLLWGVAAHEVESVKALQLISGNLTREAEEPVSSASFVYRRKTRKIEEIP